MTGESILVVDDEPSILEVVGLYLSQEGYRVVSAADGRTGLAAAQRARPDLVILDLMLPGMGGLEVCRALRAEPGPPIPIIMLTARGEEADRVVGLELGADDYVVKPFSPRELVARVRAVLRRARAPASPTTALTFEGLRIEPATRQVAVDGQPVVLTAREFDLLLFLAQHPQQVFTRDQLMDHVWGYEIAGDTSTVTVHVRRLREKIEQDPTHPRYVVTVWGVGYRFEATP